MQITSAKVKFLGPVPSDQKCVHLSTAVVHYILVKVLDSSRIHFGNIITTSARACQCSHFLKAPLGEGQKAAVPEFFSDNTEHGSHVGATSGRCRSTSLVAPMVSHVASEATTVHGGYFGTVLFKLRDGVID